MVIMVWHTLCRNKMTTGFKVAKINLHYFPSALLNFILCALVLLHHVTRMYGYVGFKEGWGTSHVTHGHGLTSSGIKVRPRPDVNVSDSEKMTC